MIRVTNTENLTGVCIAGDYGDLNALVQALHEITVSDLDDDFDRRAARYLNTSFRVLGFTYDVRHAAQGDRDISTEPNNIRDYLSVAFGKALPEVNVYYSCNVLYPEVILVTMALNDLIKHRTAKLAKSRYSFEAPWDKAVVWDRSIAAIRGFQAAFLGAISEVLAKSALSRWMNLVHHPTTSVVDITNPFVDMWNLRYIEMNRETRAKKLGIITKRFVEHQLDPEDQEYRYAIDRAVLQHECAEGDVRFDGLDYPEEIEW